MGRKKSAPGPLTLHQTAEPGTGPSKHGGRHHQQRQQQQQQQHQHQQPPQQHQHQQRTGTQQPGTQQHPQLMYPPASNNTTTTSHSVKSIAPTLGETSQRLSPEPPPQAGSSTNSLSPKSSSPRSLYTSKFSPQNHNADGHPSRTSPSPSRSQDSIPRKDSPQLFSPPSQPQPQPQRDRHPKHDQHQHQHQRPHPPPSVHQAKQPHIAELQQRLPPITRAATASPAPQRSLDHHHAERRLKSSHGRRRDEDKPPATSQNKQGGFFNFYKSAKSSDRPPPHSQGSQTAPWARDAMNGTDQPPITKQNSKQSDIPSLPSKSETSLAGSDPNSNPASTRKGSKPKPFTLLSRTKSHRDKDGRSPRHTPSPQEARGTASTPKGPAMMDLERPEQAHVAPAPKTATIPQDRGYREAMSSAARNHSADRAPSREHSSDRRGHADREHARHQSTQRDNNGASSFFVNLRREGGRVAESIGKGLFGKGGRSASTTERDPVDDEHYVLKVINLPLVEQTRLTRISKRLEESRDKTEFWMPAFPWRAIDYLNYKGCDVEGLYRVPGSGPQIKKWQRRFDEQYDVDLFTQEDLYDINIIGSMLKAWLRELPDELFPKEAQDRVSRECAGAETVPQLLIEELSNLSPFNYYLLFAITCHLSLLLAHSDKNKMDFRNLCICFQPCMKIDAFCFKFLVCDWRDCWKGCKTEAKYIEEEYQLFDQPPPPGLGIRKKLEPRSDSRTERRPSPALLERDERDRNNSSSDSNSKKSPRGGDQSRLKKKGPPSYENGKENGNVVPKSMAANLQDAQRSASTDPDDMRPLSPIKPLSPLGF